MRTLGRLALVLMLLSVASFLVNAVRGDWPMYQGSLSRSGFYNGTLPHDNSTLWTFQTGLWIVNTPTVVDDVLYVGSMDYYVYALDSRSGDLIWKTPMPWINYLSSPTVDKAHEQVYVSCLNALYALDLTTGHIRWKFTTGNNFLEESNMIEFCAPVVNGDYVYMGSLDGYIYKLPAIDPNGDGVISQSEVIWSFQSGDYYMGNHVDGTEGWFFSFITVYPDADLVFGATAREGGTNPGKIYAIYDSSGDLYWSYKFSEYMPVINVSVPGTGSQSGAHISYDPWAGDDGLVFVANRHTLYAFDMHPEGDNVDNDENGVIDDEGEVVWDFEADDWIFTVSASYHNGRVFIGSDDGYLYALDEETGKLLWKKQTVGPIRTSVVISEDDLIYTVANYVGEPNRTQVICLRAGNGSEVWHLEMPHYVLSSFGVYNGTLYIGCVDGKVYAIGPGTPRADLVPREIVARTPAVGVKKMLMVRIENRGTRSADDFLVSFYDGDPGAGGTLISTATVPKAMPGESTPAIIQWTPDNSGDYEIYVIVDPDNRIEETYEGNNVIHHTVHVIQANPAPIAHIDDITPSDVVQGPITVEFHGTATDDIQVSAYEWYSSIDGLLSTSEDFDLSASALSIGSHIIYFRAMDIYGKWSDNDTASLIVRPSDEDAWFKWMHDVNNSGQSSVHGIQVPVEDWRNELNLSAEVGIGIIGSPVAIDGVVYYCSFSGVKAVDFDTGDEIWFYNDTSGFFSTPAVSEEKGLLIASGYDIVALDLDNGSEVWRYSKGFWEFSSPTIYDDLVFVVNQNTSSLLCLNITDGSEVWTFDFDDENIFSSPAVGFDHVYLVAPNLPDDQESFYAIYGIKIDDGTMDWRWKLQPGQIAGIGIPFTGGEIGYASPTLHKNRWSEEKNVVVVGDLGGTIYAFEPDGEQPRDLVDNDGTLSAQDDGEVKWSLDVGAPIVSTAAFWNGRLYFASWDGFVHCIDAWGDGMGGTFEYWSYDTEMPIWGSPAVSGDGVVFINSLDSYVYAFDAEGNGDGSTDLIWKHLTRGYTFIYSSPALYNGSLIITGGVGPGWMWADDLFSLGPFHDRPDAALVKSSMVVSETSPVEGDVIHIMVGVRNYGLADAEVEVYLYLNNTSRSDLIGYRRITLPADGVSGVSFVWDTTDQYGEHRIIAYVRTLDDPTPQNDMMDMKIYVVKPGEKPFAQIDMIDPDVAERRANVTIYFKGSGIAYGGITDYLWNASGEFLSDSPEFSKPATYFDLGTHKITLTVRDVGGRWSDEAVGYLKIISPGGKPIATILSIDPNPADLNDTITFRGKGTDDGEIVAYEWKIMPGGLIKWDEEFSIKASDIGGEGVYQVSFRVKDDDGQWSDPDTEALHIVSEEKMPKINITHPEDGAVVSGVVNITGTAISEYEPIRAVKVVIGEVGETPDFDSGGLEVHGTANWWAHWDTSAVSGQKAIYARAYTDSYQSKVASITVTVGGSSPTVRITNPRDGDVVAGSVEIRGRASDADGTVEKVEVSIEGGDWLTCEDTSSDGTWSTWRYMWDTTTHSDGEVTIRARSYDGSLYSTVRSIKVTIDNTAELPEVTITYPDPMGPPLAGTVTITGTAYDRDGYVVSVEITIDDPSFQTAITAQGTSSWSVVLDTTAYSDGYYTLYARAMDDDGHFSTVVTVQFMIDNRIPEAHIESIDPSMAVWSSDTIVMRGYGTNGEIEEYEWTSNKDGFLGNTSTLIIPARNLSFGEHIISLRVRASNGLWSEPDTMTLIVIRGKERNEERAWWEIPDLESIVVLAIMFVAAMSVLLLKRSGR